MLGGGLSPGVNGADPSVPGKAIDTRFAAAGGACCDLSRSAHDFGFIADLVGEAVTDGTAGFVLLSTVGGGEEGLVFVVAGVADAAEGASVDRLTLLGGRKLGEKLRAGAAYGLLGGEGLFESNLLSALFLVLGVAN